MRNKRFAKYFREYEWSNIFAMIRNNRSDPKKSDERFDGKLVVITGATSGIGYLTARKQASMGANLVCVNRNPEKAEALKKEIVNDFGVRCESIKADLRRLDDIKRAAKDATPTPIRQRSSAAMIITMRPAIRTSRAGSWSMCNWSGNSTGW